MRTNKTSVSNAVCVVAIEMTSRHLIGLTYQGAINTARYTVNHPFTVGVLLPALAITLNLITLAINLFATELFTACGIGLTSNSITNAYASPSGWDCVDTSVESASYVVRHEVKGGRVVLRQTPLTVIDPPALVASSVYPIQSPRYVECGNSVVVEGSAEHQDAVESMQSVNQTTTYTDDECHNAHVIEWALTTPEVDYPARDGYSDDYTPDTVADTIPYTPSPVAHVNLDTFAPVAPPLPVVYHSAFGIAKPSPVIVEQPTSEATEARTASKSKTSKADTATRNAAIIADAKSGMATKDIAAKYSLAPRTVQVIVKRGK